MFDPSKLDLDLDNQANKNEIEKKSQDGESKTDSNTENQKEVSSDDILISQEESILEISTDETQSNTQDPLGDISNSEEQVGIQTPISGNNESGSKTEIKETEQTKENQEEDNILQNSTGSAQEHKEENSDNNPNEIIFDININSIVDIFSILIEKEYDFVTCEANEDFVKISFKKDKTEQEVRYIKYPIYSQILIKGKTITKLDVADSSKEQEGKGNIQLKDRNYQVISKVIPSSFGEKMFLKVKEIEKKLQKKKKEKMSLSKIMSLFGAGLFSILILGGAFLAFVLFNSNNVADLTFFNNLGVNVDSIKEFTSKLVDIVFFSILLIESIFLFTFTFKAILTKKQYKQKKISQSILAIFLLIVTFMSGFLWLTLSKKINSLNSQDYGKVIFYDNDKYLSEVFDENGAKVNIDDNIIGPIILRMDIQEFMKKVIDKPFKPTSLTWIIDGEEIEKPVEDYELIREFDTAGIHNIDIIINGENIKGEEETIEQNIAKVNISHIVDITEKPQKSGGSVFDFNAQNLENLGKIKWFYIPNLKNKSDDEKTEIINKALKKEVIKGYRFTSKMIFDEEIIVGMQLYSKQDTDESLDKIFIISKENNENIQGTISFQRDPINDLQYTFIAKNADTEFGNGVIETFKWIINGKEYSKEADVGDIENSSKIEHTFNSYDTFDIQLIITDSRGETKELSSQVEVPKLLKIENGLKIYNSGEEMDDFRYKANVNEYILNDVGVPTRLTFDTSDLGQDSPLYTLEQVRWDYDSDGDYDEDAKNGNYDLETAGDHTITVKYVYKHRVLKDKKLETIQRIFIEGEKKDAVVHFEMKSDSSYAPVVVAFDASKSQIKNENIQKFIWDYGDGFTEVRDAIVPGHKYLKSGDYDVKLTIVGENGQEFHKIRKLVLKPKPQSVEISSSMKSAPVGQGIDFSSQNSEGQITSYLWKFGDGETSSEANPTYKYSKPGKYNVELIVDFANNNVMKDKIEILITDE